MKALTPRSTGVSRQSDRLTDLLSRPVILEEAGPPRAIRQLIITVSVLVAGLAIWAAVGRIAEVTTAAGQIVPAGTVQQVQHLEGGILSELLVEDGSIVRAGQPLARLSPASAGGELEQLRARQAALLLELERQRAFAEDRTANFPPSSPSGPYADIRAAQLSSLAVQREAAASQRQVLETRIAQRHAELETIIAQRDTLGRQAELMREEAGVRRDLLERGLASRLTFLESERALASVEGQFAATTSDVTRARGAVSEAEIALVEYNANLRDAALREINDLTAEIAEVRQTVARLSDRFNRLEIVAPTDGIVQGLATQTIGAVVAPGAILMEIVPVADSLVAEVRIAPREIANVSIGQPAEVTFTAFDPAQFGSLAGNIEHISPSTFVDPMGEPYYRAVIRLDGDRLGATRNGRASIILPGMVVTASIATGNRTLLQYMAGPVFRAVDGSFSER